MAESSKRKRQEDGDGEGDGKAMRPADDEELMDTLDLHGLKRLVLNFERKINKNQQLRIKFSDQPEKFMDSEVDLDEQIKKMHIIATAPSLYAELVKLNTVPSLIALLGHENADVSVDVIDLLHELLDVDAEAEEEEEEEEGAHSGIQTLVEALIDNQGLEVLVQNLARFDETQQEDAQAVFNTFSIIENLIEYKPSVANLITDKTTILTFLFNRLKAKQFDGNKLYASEILAILLQNSKENQKKIGEIKVGDKGDNGMDILLMAIALYKKHDPHTGEEEEMLENLFNCMCSCLLLPENRTLFMKAEGIELMIIIMKNKKLKIARRSALKVISFALTRNYASCKRFVEVLGLKTLFSMFMKGSASKGWTQDDDEHMISCISTLLLYIDPGTSQHERVLNKFKESDYEKVERLLELHEKYSKKVKVTDKAIAERRQMGGVTEDDEDAFYLERLDAGLYILQLVDIVIAAVSAADNDIKGKVERLFDLKNSDVAEVKDVVADYINSVGDAMSKEDKERERKHLRKLTTF